MAELKDFVLVPVGKEDFENLNELAETLMCLRFPPHKKQIKGIRKYIFEQFRKLQQQQIWLADLEMDIQSNIYFPRMIRRHSI
jgi:hypothetical protein